MSGTYKLLFSLICIILAAALLCGCTGGAKVDPVVTAAPSAAPSESPTEAPTDEPVLTEQPSSTEEASGAFLEPVPFDTAFACDLDGDGSDDTVLIESKAVNEYGDNDYTVNITLASDPDNTYTDTISFCYDGYAVIVDCDPDDGCRELLVCVWQDSDDGSTKCYRINSAGGEILTCVGGYFVGDDEESVFAGGGIKLYSRVAVLGTFDVYASYTITENGFEPIDNTWYYGDDAREVSVIAEMPVTVTDSDGEESGMTLPVGSYIVPIETDLATYALVRLSSGEEAMIFFDNNEYGIPYINGRPQHDYLDVLYAD